MRQTLRQEALHEALVTAGSPWSGLDVHAELGSTNAELATSGQLWRVVVADHQSAGRGRLGRSWEAPRGTAVTMSALLPTPPAPGWLPLVAGLAVARGITDLADLQPGLKWPNDVLLAEDDWRKVCGILCELTAAGVVVGIGVNVDQDRDELPVDTATSLRLSGAAAVAREELIVAVLGHLAALHADLVAGGDAAEAAHAAYRAQCTTIGRDVELQLGSAGPTRARAVAVDDEGRLVVDEQGRRYAVAAGDVVHVRDAGQDPS